MRLFSIILSISALLIAGSSFAKRPGTNGLSRPGDGSRVVTPEGNIDQRRQEGLESGLRSTGVDTGNRVGVSSIESLGRAADTGGTMSRKEFTGKTLSQVVTERLDELGLKAKKTQVITALRRGDAKGELTKLLALINNPDLDDAGRFHLLNSFDSLLKGFAQGHYGGAPTNRTAKARFAKAVKNQNALLTNGNDPDPKNHLRFEVVGKGNKKRPLDTTAVLAGLSVSNKMQLEAADKHPGNKNQTEAEYLLSLMRKGALTLEQARSLACNCGKPSCNLFGGPKSKLPVIGATAASLAIAALIPTDAFASASSESAKEGEPSEASKKFMAALEAAAAKETKEKK